MLKVSIYNFIVIKLCIKSCKIFSVSIFSVFVLFQTFSLYLVIVAFIFVLYIIVDIKLFVNKKNRYIDLLEKNVPQEIELKETANGEFQLNITLPEAARIAKQLEHRYCFSKDRHSANFYLKIGAAGTIVYKKKLFSNVHLFLVFCLGHLIHSGLLIGYQIMFLTSDGDAFYECASVASLILDFIYPIYSFFLLYFIFKYSNVSIIVFLFFKNDKTSIF